MQPYYEITSEQIETCHGPMYRQKPFRLPVSPFPGLCVGAHVVKVVIVWQGFQDSGIELEYEPDLDKNAPKLLHSQGWEAP